MTYISITPAGYNRFQVKPQSPEGRRWIVRNMQYQDGATACINAEAVQDLSAHMRADRLQVDVQ